MDLSDIFNRPPLILIADDDWLNRDLLTAYLTGSGCEVITAADGLEGLKAARQNPPDLALIDVQMPHMDGLTLTVELKTAPATRFVPIVIVTALDSEEEKIKAIDAGADDFVTKPYNSIVLLARVRSLLRIKKLHDDLESRNLLLRRVLNRYVAEDVADVILTDPERYLKLGGEIRPISVLFADIRGFTGFVERHTGPEVIETLNRIFPHLSQVVFNNRGTFDKYLGDGLMAFYGAPLAGEDDASRAVETAIQMQQVFSDLQKDPELDIGMLGLGIGIHSGEAIVGNIGSEAVMDYTVVGDVVNVAKRLQDIAKEGQIYLSQATFDQLTGIVAEQIQSLQLYGRSEPISAYLIEKQSG